MLGLAVALASAAFAQAPPGPATLAGSASWRRVGNAAVDDGLASVSTGPVARLWYSADGSRLYAQTRAGRVFETADSGQWRPSTAVAPAPVSAAVPILPEPGARAIAAPLTGGRYYAIGRAVYRSEDGGTAWVNLTSFRGASIVGEGAADLAVSPVNPDEVAVANGYGVWRSMDAGQSWSGLNELLPNLAVKRILATPTGARGVRIWTGAAVSLEWAPGEAAAWRPAGPAATVEREAALEQSLSRTLGATVISVAASGDYVYAGAADGRLWASSDQGRSWRPFGQAGDEGPVASITVDPRDPRVAMAAVGARPSNPTAARPAHIRRTTNAGIFWDDVTANLPDAPAASVAFDLSTGAVYAATRAGLFFTVEDLAGAGPATPWTAVPGLPDAPVADVKLDEARNQLWAAVDGYGVYQTLAPHRLLDPRLVNAADFSTRAAAPGSLLSLLGSPLDAARTASGPAPVLASSAGVSQIQVPFEAGGDSVSLSLQSGARQMVRSVPLQPVSPAIFVDADGTPMLLDADSGVFLDAMHPARSGALVQVLATGLGRVRPDWPTGLAAPVENPPRVIADVHASLDGQPVTVSRAVLAPGYIGFYLVEIELPKIVNAGPAELTLEAGGQSSNPVRIFIEP